MTATADKVIDATLRFKDKFTGKMDAAIKKMELQQKSVAKFGKKFEKTGKSITNAGKKLSATVTAPIVAIAGASIKTAADFEFGMSKVQSISGASGKEMEKLTEKAKEMGAKTKFSASESADAFSYMAMAGWKTQEMLDGIEGIMYLAGATGEDLAQTSDIVTDALTAFGMQANETDRFVNVLAKAANDSNTSVGLMGETFKYVAPVAGALGYSIEDTSVAIGLMANSGIKASNAGTALRSLLTNLSKPGKSAAAAMETLGISLTDSSGKMKPLNTLMTDLRGSFSKLSEAQKAQYATSLAGKTGMSGLLAIVNSSDKDFKKLTASIADSDGAAKKMYDTANDNLNGSLTILKSTVESIAISIGDRLSPYVKKITALCQSWAEKINGLSDDQLDMIIKIAGIAAAIGPALLAIGKVVTTIGKVMKAGRAVIKGFKLLRGAMGLMNIKVLAVIAVIVIVAGLAYLIYKNWDKIKAFFISLGEKFKEFGAKVKEVFINIKNRTVETVTNIIGKVKNFVAAVKSHGGVIGAIFQNISNRINAMKQIFGGIITFIKGIFTGNWKSAWEGVKQIFGGIFANFASIIKAPLNGVIGLVNGAIRAINKIHITIPDWVPGIGGKSFGGNLATIPFLYRGTNYFSGGSAVIHDKGAEIVNLPRGTQVIPHDRSLQIAYNRGKQASGGKKVHFEKLADTIIIREDADIEKIAQKLADILDDAGDNMGDVA